MSVTNALSLVAGVRHAQQHNAEGFTALL